jgi:very-short-patch-repair endonuclease
MSPLSLAGEGEGEGDPQAMNKPQDEQPRPSVPFARDLRQRSTDAETALWRLLRARRLAGAKFRRQRPFGPYILDFSCIEKRLAIEADGGQRFTEEGLVTDRARTRYLEQRGVRVLRFTNREILVEGEEVIAAVQQALAER